MMQKLQQSLRRLTMCVATTAVTSGRFMAFAGVASHKPALLACSRQRTNQMMPSPYVVSQTNAVHTTSLLLHRMHKIRHVKMKVHQRRKRERKNKVQIMQYQEMVKARDERAFRTRCQQLVEEATNFNAEAYVRNVLEHAAHKQDAASVVHTKTSIGRPSHWTDLISVEELYMVPYTHYIDKRTGYASPEDAMEIEKLRFKYANVYSSPYFYAKHGDNVK